MRLQISNNLKKLRSIHKTTQEQLADALGVSCQSVSRWELGICYPDIELLPAIANYFDITLDDLIGMSDIRSESRKNEIFTRTLNYERQERWDDAIDVLRNALKTYPNDYPILTELALVLSKKHDSESHLEAISISEKILANCTDEKLRSTTRANLCFLYKETNQSEKAVALGRTLPHIWESREILLPDLVSVEERDTYVVRNFNVILQVLRDIANDQRISFSLGYKAEDNIDINEFLKSLQ